MLRRDLLKTGLFSSIFGNCLPQQTNSTLSDMLTTGYSDLDKILGGGFSRGHLHLVVGSAGSGKTKFVTQTILSNRKNNRFSYQTKIDIQTIEKDNSPFDLHVIDPDNNLYLNNSLVFHQWAQRTNSVVVVTAYSNNKSHFYPLFPVETAICLTESGAYVIKTQPTFVNLNI